jgi:uncharacterized protein YbaA (DUF1428 family)
MAKKMNSTSLYVDGFVLPVPKKNLSAYRRMSQKAGKVWMEHGALEYRECVGDDLKPKGIDWPFARTVAAKANETVIFSWITYKSKAHRDQVNKKVMADPRIRDTMSLMAMPFDAKRMAYGGFKTIVKLDQ